MNARPPAAQAGSVPNMAITSVADIFSVTCCRSLYMPRCCWCRCSLRSSTLYFGWLLPMCVIILHNLVVFTLVVRVLAASQPGHATFNSRLTVSRSVLVMITIRNLSSTPTASRTETLTLTLTSHLDLQHRESYGHDPCTCKMSRAEVTRKPSDLCS